MKKMLLAYNWSGTPTEEEIKKLTHLNIAFGQLFCDGSVKAAHHPKMERISDWKTWNPNIKISVSFGIGQPSAFTMCAADQKKREIVAQNMVKLIKDYDLDGIDLDWEFPCMPSNGQDSSLDDKENFTLLCKEIRKAFDASFEEKKLLTIAAGADLYYVRAVELVKLMEYIDYVYLMTYDLKCGFHALAGHHTALYSNLGDVFMNSCDQALKLFVSEGVPKEKLLMGAAFYSRKWENLQDRNHGLLQISKLGGAYGPNFDALDREYINKNGYVRYWDEEAHAPYLFNGSIFLSYDDEQSLTEKARYCVEEGYAGVFYWEHGCDKTGKLLDALYKNLQ